MGTNFYWKNINNEKILEKHIGKRSAAGLYCWDCGSTLNYGGIRDVHKNLSVSPVCLNCKKSQKNESLCESTAGRELGFNKSKPIKKTGVSSCSSFTWTLMKHKREINKLKKVFRKIIVDEYGKEYTAVEFLQILEECPIEFQLASDFS
jgi:hypothetical protein